MIHSITQITVNGSSQFMGGYIFNARINISFGEGSTTISLSVVSENGSYSITPESISNPYANQYKIQIGSAINFACYLDEYDFTVSPGGNILNLRFTDTSRILDVVEIGLFKKHGITSTPNLILVGKEINPCNNEIYGSDAPKTYYDPCHPCINSLLADDLKNYIDCIEKNKYDILDVAYNFGELISKIPIKMEGARDPNPKYLAQYSGILRDVLNAWCRDFGWFYYWNNGVIVFKDLRNTIEVNANIENFCPNLLEYTTSYSMKNSVKTATITNFSRPGDPARLYECQSSKYIVASTLTQNTAGLTMPLGLTTDVDPIAAGLANYSDELRSAYYWYVKYQMYNSSNYTQGKKLEKLGITILSAPIKLGKLNTSNSIPYADARRNPNINKVPLNATSISPFAPGNESAYSSNNISAIKQNQDFYYCLQLLSPEDQAKVVDAPDNYFFFVAEHNRNIDQKFADDEKAFSQIMNRYAIYVPNSDDKFFEDFDFELDQLCGISKFVNTGTVSYNFIASGNVHFYNTSTKGDVAGNGTPMNSLPFANFLSVLRNSNGGSTAGNSLLGFKLILIDRGSNSFSPNTSTDLTGNSTAIRNRILINRVPKYFPLEVANKNNLKGEFITKFLQNVSSGYSNENDVFLYMGTVLTQDAFNLTQRDGFSKAAQYGNLYDGKPLNKEIDPTLQRTSIVYQYPELQCKIIGNFSYNNPYTLHANVVTFRTPASTFEYTEPTDALYGVVVEKVRQKRRIIEKVESFNTTNIDGDSYNFAKLVVNSNNISDDRLKVLTQNDTVCEFSQEKIRQIHEDFSSNLSVTFTKPSVSKVFRIAGIELPNGFAPTIENGLVSVEVGLDGNNAVYSVYEFSTRLMRLPAENFVFSLKSDMLSNPGAYTNTTNHYPTVRQPNV